MFYEQLEEIYRVGKYCVFENCNLNGQNLDYKVKELINIAGWDIHYNNGFFTLVPNSKIKLNDVTIYHDLINEYYDNPSINYEFPYINGINLILFIFAITFLFNSIL